MVYNQVFCCFVKSLILLLIDKDNFEKIFNQYEKLIFSDQFSSLLSEEK